MLSRFTPRWFLLIGALALTLVASVVVAFTTRTVDSAQAPRIVPAIAIRRALAYAQDNGRVGGLVAAPTEVRGQLMTYNQAVQFIFGQPIAPTDGIAALKDNQVWLIVFRGPVVVHNEAHPGTSAQDDMYNQICVIVDSKTAEVLEVVMHPPGQELAINGLPVLSLPDGSDPPAPSPAPIATAVPVPTAAPAPLPPVSTTGE